MRTDKFKEEYYEDRDCLSMALNVLYDIYEGKNKRDDFDKIFLSVCNCLKRLDAKFDFLFKTKSL